MSTTERQRTSARRESLLGDQPGAFASARFVRITPMKARRVVDMVRGLPVEEALAAAAVRAAGRLRDRPQGAGERRRERRDHRGPRHDDLVVSVAQVDEGPTMKRWRPRAQGRATRINKRTSHITLVVQPAEVVAAQKATPKKRKSA